MLTRFARRLYRHYEDYHAYGPSRLKTIGILGAVTYCLFYFLRFTRPNPSLMADLPERALAVERELQALLFNSQDAKEGLSAYVEKRPAEFKAK